MKHKNCGGKFEQYVITGHQYCFLRCNKCLDYLGGDKVKKEVNKLVTIKVWPRVVRS